MLNIFVSFLRAKAAAAFSAP